MSRSLAWGKVVSPAFRDRVFWIGDQLQLDPNYLMAAMAWESGETFSASIRNAAGSGAVGLIQFMPTTAKNLGTSTAELAKMTAENQLNYVYKYFKPYKGRIKTLADLYMVILWPKGVGQPESFVLWSKAGMPTTYGQNAGLDVNRDGVITKAEATKKVNDKLIKGMSASRLWVE